MRVIGLLGGMSWESTLEYYRIINRATRDRLGGQRSARLVMISVDFEEIERLQRQSDWESAGRRLAEEAARLEAAGADLLLVCSNTMHKVAATVENAVRIPLIHIADATADRVKNAGLSRVGLLGTRFTMEEEFYRGRLGQHGIDVLIPAAADRAEVDRVIFQELCRGEVNEAARQQYVRIIGELEEQGAEGVILGCTEIGLLIGPRDVALPVFDTARIHAEKAVELALEL